MYSNIQTGQVAAPDLAMIASSPFLSWSVLLLGIYVDLHHLLLHNVPVSLASWTMTCNIFTVIGFFFLVGLASILRSPKIVVWISGISVGDGNPAKLCAQAMAYTAFLQSPWNMLSLLHAANIALYGAQLLVRLEVMISSPYLPAPEGSKILDIGTACIATQHDPWQLLSQACKVQIVISLKVFHTPFSQASVAETQKTAMIMQ